MKTLQIIQTVSKIAGIVCKVISVFCIVGFCLCIVGIVSMAVGAPAMQFGGVTFESMMQHNTEMSTGSLYAAMAAGAVVCAGECVLTKFAAHYLTRELKDGTPFTSGGARELLRLGILSLCIPVGTQVIAQIIETGALLIVLALVCRYGAEMTAQKPAENLPQDPAPDA